MADQKQTQMTPATKAKQLADQQIGTLKKRLEQKREDIVEILGADEEARRLMMAALMAAADNQRIRECEPNSIVRAVIEAALCGADIAAGVGEGYLVPYFNKELGQKECQFQPGYRLGQRRIQEATRLRVFANVVCEKDHWRYSEIPLVLEHTSADGDHGTPDKPGGRGKWVRAYACAVDDQNRVMFAQTVEVTDIQNAMKAARKGGDKDSPAWRMWPDRMWRKVAIMRLAKEVRAWRQNPALDRLLLAEERNYLPAYDAPKALPAAAAEGRGRIGASSYDSPPIPEPQSDELPEPEIEQPAKAQQQKKKASDAAPTQPPVQASAPGQGELGW